jgi:YhcH/YjgK/YiaL family protein
MSYPTRFPEDAVLEAHQKYVDIQTSLAAAEGIEWFPLDTLEVKTPYEATKDVALYHRPRPGPARVDVYPGIFVALFPHDAHMPQLIVDNAPGHVKKVVVKINVALLKVSAT